MSDDGDGWVGVDLDGTLAEYHGWQSDGGVGVPIMPMVERVTKWLESGQKVKIFTARVGPRQTEEERLAQVAIIEEWCEKNLGKVLEVTATKDFQMIRLYDDRCVQVETNTGRLVGGRFGREDT